MKRICVLGYLLFISLCLWAQEASLPASTIQPYQLAIGFSKTTNILFPYAVRSVDIGSSAVMARKAKGVETILQVKASQRAFEPTNLSVVTADGRFYSFALVYQEAPATLNISFAPADPVQLSGVSGNEALLEHERYQVLGMERMFHLKRRSQDVRLGLKGVYLGAKAMWMDLRVINESQIGFRPGYLRFFIRDRKKSKRTALQETELFPVFAPIGLDVEGLDQQAWTVAFAPFSIPSGKKLVIQVGEKENGRSVILSVKGKYILKAQTLP